MKFAAYDKDAIYATSDSPDGAIQRARREMRDPEAELQTAPIRDGLAAAIEEAGWNAHLETFAIDAEGFIIDTTNA